MAQEKIQTISLEQGYSTFPFHFLYVVLLISLIPITLNFIGINFGSVSHGISVQEMVDNDLSRGALLDQMFYTLTGGLHHGLLEWSAVMVAMLTIILAFAHFAINKDVTMPIIGIALFCSGTMDAFHTMAAMRLVDAVADNTDLIPFTWALSRGFNAGIMIIGALTCLGLNITSLRSGIFRIIFISAIFSIIAYALIIYAANSNTLPQTQFPDSLITRPYDVFPLVLFVIAIPIFWRLYKKNSNLLTASLVIAIIPEIVLEAHMSFGSSQLFDNHFNIAHFLKIVAYIVPFIGLILDYVRTYQVQYHTQIILKDREKHLAQANDELEEFAYRTSHDLRSPIISSISLLAMTRQSIKDGNQDKALMSLSHAQNSLEKLDTLIQDILVLTEAKYKEEENQTINISVLVDEALKKLSHMDRFEFMDIQKDFQFNSDLYSQKSRVNMILENLISNAIKYQDTEKESPYMIISTRNTNDNFVLEVKDNGLGIPKDQQDKLFTMFKRFHPRVAFGSGLGLYLMKKSADVLNGTITFHDHQEGTIFRLSIPLLKRD